VRCRRGVVDRRPVRHWGQQLREGDILSRSIAVGSPVAVGAVHGEGVDIRLDYGGA
jgi:hypothetical protein